MVLFVFNSSLERLWSRARREAPGDLRRLHPVDGHQGVHGGRQERQEHLHLQWVQSCVICVSLKNRTSEIPKTHLTTFHCPAAKTGKLDLPDMEVFKKQAACLNFPPEFHFGESTGEMLIHRCTNHTKEHRSWNLFSCLSTRFPPPVFRSVSLREGGCDSCVGGRTIEIWSYSLT